MSSPRKARITINTGRGRQTKTNNKVAGPGRKYVGPYVTEVCPPFLARTESLAHHRKKGLMFNYLSQLLMWL
jgi:hypothetical protein